jgi:hypothetical protein
MVSIVTSLLLDTIYDYRNMSAHIKEYGVLSEYGPFVRILLQLLMFTSLYFTYKKSEVQGTVDKNKFADDEL